MNDITIGLLLGVVAGPAAVGLVALLLTLCRALLFVTAHLTATGTSRETRAAVAAALYGSRRARVFAFGDVGVALIVGMDHEARKDAYLKLRPTVSLRRLKQKASDEATQ